MRLLDGADLNTRCRARLLLAACVLAAGSCAESDAPGDHRAAVTVFGAASATDVLAEAGRRFEAETGLDVRLSLDGSSRLARQIAAGAPVDVYLSADREWMDHLDSAALIRPETRSDLLANSLVLIAPAGDRWDVEMSPGFDFAERLPRIRRVAAGDPTHVPAGRYARQALESLGWWDALAPRLVTTGDVRAALRLVEIGEADAGIVYATDARRSDRVQVVAVFPPALHEPIRYPVARCSDSDAGAAFIEFLRTLAMREVFESAGFRVLPDGEG